MFRLCGALCLAWLGLQLVACNPSVVRPGDTLYQDTLGVAEEADAPVFLAVPLSGPRWSTLNAFGEGAVLPAGTPVMLDGLERAPATGTFPREVGGGDPRGQVLGTVFRLRFHTGSGLCAQGCVARWRLPDEARFRERFRQVFVPEDPLAGLDPDVRRLVTEHRIAGWFDRRLLTLAAGLPNSEVESLDGGTWVYERRFCQGQVLVAVPSLMLFLEGGRPSGYSRMDATDFYYVREPVDPHTGLCRHQTLDPLQVLRTPGTRDYRSPSESKLARHRPDHRIIDRLEGGRTLQRPSPDQPIHPDGDERDPSAGR